MINVLVLGHKGMLGNAVCSYLEKTGRHNILTINTRYGEEGFKKAILNTDPEYIINCIGIIPQKKPTMDDYRKINIELPILLETLDKKIINPSTDCEFAGTIPPTERYKKKHRRDAVDDYGKSKAEVSELIEDSFKNTKIIRTSIIGHERATNVALLDWFLNAEGSVNGYTNHYWNGITTLEWAKLSEELMDRWEAYPIVNQYGTDIIASKYDLLCTIKDVYNKDVQVVPFETEQSVNKCLESDRVLPSIKTQLEELKRFYSR